MFTANRTLEIKQCYKSYLGSINVSLKLQSDTSENVDYKTHTNM